MPSIVSSLLQEFKYVIPEDDPGDLPPEETKEIQSQVEEFISPCVIHVLLDPKKDGLWRICIYFHTINNIMVKIRGRIFSRKGGMMKIKAQRIRDARVFTTYIGNSFLIMENSDLGEKVCFRFGDDLRRICCYFGADLILIHCYFGAGFVPDLLLFLELICCRFGDD